MDLYNLGLVFPLKTVYETGAMLDSFEKAVLKVPSGVCE